MASINTPYGRIVWSGPVLEESTLITIVKDDRHGGQIVSELPLSRMIAMTNGGVLPYLPSPPEVVVTPVGG